MKSENEEELRNFFCFLASDREFSNVEKIKAEDLAFGVDCYLHGLSEVAKRRLKEQIFLKSKDQHISYEDFKNLWYTNFELGQEISVKEATNEVFNLMTEFLGKNRLMDKIGVEDLDKLLEDLDIGYYNKNDENENSEVNKKEKRKKAVDDMIDSLDNDNDKFVTKKDFEYIMMEYLNKKK